MARMTLQQMTIRIFLAAEVMVFGLVYLFGSHGIAKMRSLQSQTLVIQQEITNLEKDIKELDESIIAWNKYSFYKEKIAREELQFAKEGDEIYYIGRSKLF